MSETERILDLTVFTYVVVRESDQTNPVFTFRSHGIVPVGTTLALLHETENLYFDVLGTVLNIRPISRYEVSEQALMDIPTMDVASQASREIILIVRDKIQT